MPSAPAVQCGSESPPIVAQSSVKIELPKPFIGRIDNDIHTWLYAIDPYFKAENQIPQGPKALKAALNFTDNVSTYFRSK